MGLLPAASGRASFTAMSFARAAWIYLGAACAAPDGLRRGRALSWLVSGHGAVGERQLDAERRALSGLRLGRDAAAVRLGHGRDDREPEADAAARARARGVGAVEPLEEALDLLRVE